MNTDTKYCEEGVEPSRLLIRVYPGSSVVKISCKNNYTGFCGSRE
jgi:hypothetical protein